MPWRGPEYDGEFPSLGWALVDWWQDHFKVPAGEHYGKPFALTDEQIEFFVRLYRVDPVTGQRVVRRATRRGAKGKGKSPEGALFVGAEFCGPVVFDGWNAAGEPVGRPQNFPWVQVAAVSEEQTGNLYLVLREMLADSSLIDDLGIDLGKTRVEFRNGPGRIEPVTASAGAREGQPITGGVLEETHLWFPSQGGQKMAAVMRRNAGKTGGCTLETTNAPALGERSVAEDSADAHRKNHKALDVLYDSVSAGWDRSLDPKKAGNKPAVMKALRHVYGAAALSAGGWVDLDRIYAEILDPATTTSEVLRFYFNDEAKADSKAFDPAKIAATKRNRRKIPTEKILMFDGARTRDCSVLSSWTIEATPHHQCVRVWERPANADDTYEHPRSEINGAVLDFMHDNDCVLFVYDSSFHELAGMYDAWTEDFGEANPDKGTGLMVGYPTAGGSRMDAAIRRLLEDMDNEKQFTHDGDTKITEHLLNTMLARKPSGQMALAKEKDSLKIDGAVTMTFGYDMVPTGRLMLSNRQAAPPIYVALS